MASRNDRDNHKLTEKYKNILAIILSREDNKFCADCLAKGPRWASWNLGVLLCIRCSGLHRAMGVHISRVKSVNLDTWTKQQMLVFCCRGNGWAKEMYEAKLPKEYRRPQTDSSLEYFIRDKYEKKKYISPVEIPLRPLTGLGLLEDEVPKKRKSERPKEGVSVVSIPKPRGLRPVSPVIPRPKSLPQLPKFDANPAGEVSHRHQGSAPTTDDLLGLSSPIPKDAAVSISVTTAPLPSADLSEDLFGPLSSFQSHSITASVSSPDLLNSGTELSNGTTSEPKKEKADDAKLSKDSILSLYSQGTRSSPINGGNFMSQANMGYQQPAQQPNQQQAYLGMNMHAYQQQMAGMQQQQFQMNQMSQQMAGMNMGGYPGMMQQPQSAQMQMQANAGYGYQTHPQMGQAMYGQPTHGQQMYGAMMGQHVGGGTAMSGVPGYAAGGMMQTNGGMNQPNMWGTGAVSANMMSGHTLSNQLWK